MVFPFHRSSNTDQKAVPSVEKEKWRRKIGHAFKWKICYQVAPDDGPKQGADNGKRNKTETLGDLQSKSGVSGIGRGKDAS